MNQGSGYFVCERAVSKYSVSGCGLVTFANCPERNGVPGGEGKPEIPLIDETQECRKGNEHVHDIE
jgi:hypothetical protein